MLIWLLVWSTVGRDVSGAVSFRRLEEVSFWRSISSLTCIGQQDIPCMKPAHCDIYFCHSSLSHLGRLLLTLPPTRPAARALSLMSARIENIAARVPLSNLKHASTVDFLCHRGSALLRSSIDLGVVIYRKYLSLPKITTFR
jgi:hypothetical protein